ncbi:Signal transduction response regulator [Labilithrix luteola]|uniref:Signal transduction response regulator n=2 Tax=Labilithrix luteola TaxID=1391654 RepID=A0A0K1PWI1_9BACT|nr:Signal transduction response regulator [Labilithrix luteola]
MPRVIVAGSPTELARITDELARSGFRADLVTVSNRSDLEPALGKALDVFVCGEGIPSLSPRDIRLALDARDIDAPLVVLTEQTTAQSLDTARRARAADVVDEAGITRLSFVLTREVERKRATDEWLRERDNAEHARRRRERDHDIAKLERNEFLMSFLREIRRPLNRTLDNYDRLLREESEALSVDGQIALKSIEQGTCAMLAVLNDVLDLASVNREWLEVLATAVTKHSVPFDRMARHVRDVVGTAERAERAARMRILHVDASRQNRDVVRQSLAGEFELLEAHDAEEGIVKAARDAPDLILMDISLPRLDGCQATARLKADPKLKRIPVIAIAAQPGDDERRRAREAGCVEYLTIPLEQDLLVDTMRRHLSSDTRVSSTRLRLV